MRESNTTFLKAKAAFLGEHKRGSFSCVVNWGCLLQEQNVVTLKRLMKSLVEVRVRLHPR